MRWAPAYLLPFLVAYAALDPLTDLGGWRHFQIVTAFFLVVVPLDILVGRYQRDLLPDDPWAKRQDWAFRAILWLWAPVALGMLGGTLWVVANRDPNLLQFSGLVLTAGFVNGIVGVVFAHELMHRASRWERWLGEFYMTLVSYPHFCQEHVHGHHRKVATLEDPATARFGESLYRFLPRLWLGEAMSVWRMECARLAKRERPIWSWRNRVLRQAATVAVLYVAIAIAFGWMGVVAMAGQSFIAVALLGVVNYIEHYGLLRRRLASGEYERLGPQHSWDSAHLVTNLFTANLGRHADHHMRAGRKYQYLKHNEQAARLPVGYPGMVLLALLPPLFFRIMNPRVEGRRYAAEQAALAASAASRD